MAALSIFEQFQKAARHSKAALEHRVPASDIIAIDPAS